MDEATRHLGNFGRRVAVGLLAAGLLSAAGAGQAATLEKDGDVATAIRGLAIGGTIYDVTFPVTSSGAVYGTNPPIFDFGTSAEAQTATDAVVAVLNADGGVLAIGVSAANGRPIFRIPWDIRDIRVPIVDIVVEFLLVWEGVTGDKSSPGVWGRPSDSDQFPFLDDGGFAKFEVVDSNGPGNAPPVADADGPYEGSVGVAVQFDGTGSNDPEGSITQYRWQFGDGTTAQGPNRTMPEHVYAEPGTYNVTLRVTDAGGLQASDGTTASVGAGSQPPVADAGGPYRGTVGAGLKFDGTGSTDADGTIKKYWWNFGDGSPTKGGKKPTHTYTKTGKYTVTLRVVDDSGEDDTDTATVDVGKGNQPPTADPAGPYQGTVGTPVQFDGGGSSDPDGSIANYKWDFGDGSPAIEGPQRKAPKHTYTAAGTYTVNLTVTDDKGAVDSGATTTAIVE